MSSTRQHLEAVANVNVIEALSQDVLYPILTSPPFIPTNSLLNLRDPGAVPGSSLPTSRFYRCGMLADDPEALSWLAGNVKRIFDLRTPEERIARPDPDVPGVENVWLEGNGVYLDPKVEEFVEEGGRKAWKKQLMAMTVVYAPMFRAVLEHVRDKPSEPILFHCTAGRDRTGVLAALLHVLAGTPHDTIILDYIISRIGLEPAREKLTQFALQESGAASIETPGFLELATLKGTNLEALEEGLREKYGGWEGYVTSEEGLGLKKEDLETVKRNLRT